MGKEKPGAERGDFFPGVYRVCGEEASRGGTKGAYRADAFRPLVRSYLAGQYRDRSTGETGGHAEAGAEIEKETRTAPQGRGTDSRTDPHRTADDDDCGSDGGGASDSLRPWDKTEQQGTHGVVERIQAPYRFGGWIDSDLVPVDLRIAP